MKDDEKYTATFTVDAPGLLDALMGGQKRPRFPPRMTEWMRANGFKCLDEAWAKYDNAGWMFIDAASQLHGATRARKALFYGALFNLAWDAVGPGREMSNELRGHKAVRDAYVDFLAVVRTQEDFEAHADKITARVQEFKQYTDEAADRYALGDSTRDVLSMVALMDATRACNMVEMDEIDFPQGVQRAVHSAITAMTVGVPEHTRFQRVKALNSSICTNLRAVFVLEPCNVCEKTADGETVH